MQIMAMHTFTLNFGPHSCEIIVRGFKERVILPFGSGKNGCWFGFSLPFPAGFFFAYSFVRISIETSILPIFLTYS